MQYSEKELKVITRVYCLFQDNLSCIETWGFYLFSKELDREVELRNRIGIIWLASLFDSISAQTNLISKYEKEALTLNLIHIPRYCRQASMFIDSVKELLDKYTVPEQIFIQNLRNQWVHSHLNGRHADSIKVKHLEHGKLTSKNYSFNDYHDLLRPLFEQGEMDSTLTKLISRFTTRTDPYWVMLSEIQRNHKLMYQEMRKGREFQWRTICV